MKYLIKIFTLITSFIKSIKINYPIAKNTWFGSGGKTSIFFEAQSIISLKFFLSLLPINIPIFTIGMGSNNEAMGISGNANVKFSDGTKVKGMNESE